MTKYIVKSYLALINRFEAFAKNLGSFGLAVIYTIGHIWIAILCAAFIFDAPLNLAAIDAFIEPVINGFWFYALHKVFAEILGKITLTVVYTIGHIFIATMCAVIIFSATVNLAAIDAFIEPVINGFWFYALHKVCSEILGRITLTVIYTIGHIFIATMCAVIIFSATVNLAAIDAFVEPIINAFWFYFLHSFYGAYSQKREVSYE